MACRLLFTLVDVNGSEFKQSRRIRLDLVLNVGTVPVQFCVHYEVQSKR